MKKVFIILLSVLTVLITGCTSDENYVKETPGISGNISSMEILIDNNLIKITDELTYKDLEKMGFQLDENYSGVLEKTIKPSKSADSMSIESFNIKTSKDKPITVSVVNTGKKDCFVKDALIYFISTYNLNEYDQSYILPAEIKHKSTADKMKEAWGEPQVDLTSLDDGKMIQYLNNNCTFTANLDNDCKMESFSFNLNANKLFK